jgi:hypothetical protein
VFFIIKLSLSKNYSAEVISKVIQKVAKRGHFDDFEAFLKLPLLPEIIGIGSFPESLAF